MATTQNTYTGNGSTTNYSFTFEYISQEDVKASLNGAATTAFTFANATTVAFTTAPANGDNIVIFRDTANDATVATFFAGSAIKAEDLNANFDQALYVSQETDNNALSTLGGTMTGQLDMGNQKIVNLATPTATNDASTKEYVDGLLVSNQAQIAAAVATATASATNSATAAAASASQASTSATSLSNSAAAAATSAAASLASQNAAAASVSAASTSATNAAASATISATFAGKSIFYGYKRNATSNLELYYSSPTDTTTYEVKDYQYKDGNQWYIGANDLLHTSGPNVGQPKIEFNSNGHLILTA